jgi:hypothetical protein
MGQKQKLSILIGMTIAAAEPKWSERRIAGLGPH